eukprot:6197804-Pleurochrysis_carterae.AAC.2
MGCVWDIPRVCSAGKHIKKGTEKTMTTITITANLHYNFRLLARSRGSGWTLVGAEWWPPSEPPTAAAGARAAGSQCTPITSRASSPFASLTQSLEMDHQNLGLFCVDIASYRCCTRDVNPASSHACLQNHHCRLVASFNYCLITVKRSTVPPVYF